MNRRENLKLLFTGTLASGLMLTACNPEDKAKEYSPKLLEGGTVGGRIPEEKELDQKLLGETFFTEEERKKLEYLVDIIIPKDEKSGSATDAGVPDFIEFMVKDHPENQTPLRGGLRWLDTESADRFDKHFMDTDESQRMEIIEDIAWPDKAKPEVRNGVKFFNILRNLTSTGFFTSEMGFQDLGYVGNRPNMWEGVPEEVMKKYGFELEEKYKDLYIRPEDRGALAEWDEDGNLIRNA